MCNARRKLANCRKAVGMKKLILKPLAFSFCLLPFDDVGYFEAETRSANCNAV